MSTGGLIVKLPDPAFWEDKRVFITGAKGFKGKWLVQWLDKLGAYIETNQSIDICDKDAMQELIYHFNPDIVFHLAAVSTVQEAYVNPIKAMETNAVGTTTLFDVLKKQKDVKAIINVTTDKVYHVEGLERGYTELDALGGLEPYAISKVCSEYVSKVYQKTYGMPIATARAGNVIGGGDFKRSRIIPNYYYSYIEGKSLDVNIDAVRPWQYVLDCLCGYLLLCEKLYDNKAYAGAWNFASNEYESKSVQWIVDEMNWWFDSKVKYNVVSDRGFFETKQLTLCSDKAKHILEWEPQYDMKEMVARTADWYKEFMSGQPLEYLHDKEIDEYMGNI